MAGPGVTPSGIRWRPSTRRGGARCSTPSARARSRNQSIAEQSKPPPRMIDDPLRATDPYTTHKIECEKLVRESGLGWCIFRFTDVPIIGLRDPHPIMFEIGLHNRIEALHPVIERLQPSWHLHGHIHPYGRRMLDREMGRTTIRNVIPWRMVDIEPRSPHLVVASGSSAGTM